MRFIIQRETNSPMRMKKKIGRIYVRIKLSRGLACVGISASN